MVLRLFFLMFSSLAAALAADDLCPELAKHFHPPEERSGFGSYSRLIPDSGDWAAKRKEIAADWNRLMGPWPPLLVDGKLVVTESIERENVWQKRVFVEIARGLTNQGWLLVPKGKGPFPAVLAPYYESESSIGLGKVRLRDFGWQLAKRGFVTLSIGSPGGDARAPDLAGATCQPLSFLAYVAANCRIALARLPEVDSSRIGIVGHSYGGKWAMFAACLDEKFACGVWSDPGIVFDESRPNVNYWEPWYLGKESNRVRVPGIVSAQNPRTGAYRQMMNERRDLHEIMALMAPRPYLVSGGSEDPPDRWDALNRVREVYALVGAPNRVGMTHRELHDPTEESNGQIYKFFECVLRP